MEEIASPAACRACGHTSRAGRRFCAECGAPLASACPACGAANEPGEKFCGGCGTGLAAGGESGASALAGAPSARAPRARAPRARAPRDYTPKHLAERILRSRAALEGERKQVTVLFADVKGSLELSEQLDPEAWHRILEGFFQILADGIHRFEGTVNQYTGDGIMALFGAPVAHEDHAQRACYAALTLLGELQRHAREVKRAHGLGLSTRIGIHSGEVVVGKIGDDLRMDYTAQGHTVGLAQRMESLAEPGACYVSAATAALVAGYFALEDVGEFVVKGVGGPVRAFSLRGAGALRTRFDASRARGLTRFVGRGDELASLEAALARALAGQGQTVGVMAEAGTGKSRLCFELVERARARGIAVHEAQALSHGALIPFLPILQLLRSWFGIGEGEAAASARRKIAGSVLLADATLEPVLPLLFDFLGVPDPDRPAPRLEAEARQRQLAGLVQRLLRTRPAREPALLLIEDLHWLDPASGELLAAIAEGVAGAHVLLVVNYRPEFQAEWMRRSWYQQLPLAPLGGAAALELLTALLGSDPSLAQLASAIRERTGGNPFFAEEMVQSLAETGVLAGARGSYRLARPVETPALPATVQALLAARIDRLGEREKQVLCAAAVVGREFPLSLAARAADLAEPEAAAALRALTAAELVFEQALYPEPEYAFKHPLTQEVAYRTPLGERRAAAHRRVADALVLRAGDEAGAQAPLLAHHFDAAGASREALHWHERAGRTLTRSDPAAALHSWRRLRELADPDDAAGARTRLYACGRILDLLWQRGDPEGSADTILEEGRLLAAQTGELRRLAFLHLSYGAVLGLRRDDSPGRLEHTALALDLARECGDARLELASLAQLSLAYFLTSPRAQLAHAEAALALPTALDRLFGWRRPMTIARASRAQALAYLGRLDEAAEEASRAAEIARKAQDHEALFTVEGVASLVAWLSGRSDDALAHAHSQLEISQRTSVLASTTYGTLGAALVECRQWDDAIRAVESYSGAGFGLPDLVLAQARLARGFPDQASAAAKASVALAAASGCKLLEIRARCTLARVRLRTRGATARDAIEAELAQADALVEETGARGLAPFVLAERAALARTLGDETGWEDRLREAQRLWAALGAPARVEQLEAELRAVPPQSP